MKHASAKSLYFDDLRLQLPFVIIRNYLWKYVSCLSFACFSTQARHTRFLSRLVLSWLFQRISHMVNSLCHRSFDNALQIFIFSRENRLERTHPGKSYAILPFFSTLVCRSNFFEAANAPPRSANRSRALTPVFSVHGSK